MNKDKKLLKEIAETLDRWAQQSKTGGWSTHQVKPQEELATKIHAHLSRNS